jgi:hypothetical protein
MSHPSRDIADDLAPLEVLAELFATELRDGHGPALAIGVVPSGRDVELHLRELPDSDPIRLLLGFRAPAEWTAFGVASRARLRDPQTARTVAEGAGFTHFSARSGGFAFAVADQNDEPLVESGPHLAEGRVPDACRRVLALPTPPPEHDSRELMAVQWLDSLAARALEAEPGSLDWVEAVATNPQAALIAEVDPSLAAQIPDHVEELGNAFRRGRPWAHLRAEHAADRVAGFDLDPEHSAWMDEGMFARWAIDSYPPPHHLLEIVDERLSAEVSRRVRSTLRTWGLEVDS